MPLIFTRDEVKMFLQEQGFDITNEDMLDRFIKDLKKVVKYESIRRRRQRLGHPPDETVLDSTDGRNYQTTTSSNSTGTSSRSGGDGYDIGDSQFSTPKSFLTSLKTQIYTDSEESETEEDETDSGNIPSSYYENDYDVIVDVPTTGKHESFFRDKDESLPPLPTQLAPLKGITNQHQNQAPKKPGKGSRLIMKRVTAATNEMGDSVIEESDVDLGLANQTGHRKAGFGKGTRPRTAPPGRPTPISHNIKPFKQPPVSRPKSARDKPNTCDERDNERHQLQRSSAEVMYTVTEEDLDKFISDLELDESEETSSRGSKKKIPVPPPNVNRDPVLLYHWYKKNHWDVYSIPGEDRHMQLRWHIRAKTVGGHVR